MTTNYKEYQDAKIAINSVIENKENEIIKLETEITELRRVRRMMDEEFTNRIKEKPEYLG